jgi:RHS repeat-associated protein
MRGKYLYSPDGERTQKQTAAGDAFYVNQFFVLQPSGILPTKHIFAGETRIVTKTDPISQVPMISYYHPDHLGSTSYTSAGDQSLLQHERYFPFGERDTGDQEECDLGRPDNMRRSWIFNSKELDFDTGLYYFGARYYDPKMSVWQSADPVLASYMGGSPNAGVYHPRNLGLYTYTWNNPVALRDPDGRWANIKVAGNEVSIRIPIVVVDNSSGPGSSSANVASLVGQWKADIEKTWSGDFSGMHVTTKVEMLDASALKNKSVEGLNVLTVVPASNLKSEGGGSASIWELGPDDSSSRRSEAKHEGSMVLPVNAPSKAAGHEAGHALGLSKGHTEAMKKQGGKTIMDPANIMTPHSQGRAADARPSAAEVNKIVKEHGR